MGQIVLLIGCRIPLRLNALAVKTRKALINI